MPLYKMTLAYDGTVYHGWQIQPSSDTIQERVQRTLGRIAKDKVDIVASGRTDSGVHALGQVAHFRLDRAIEPEGVLRGLNAMLPSDIRVRAIEYAATDFHARYGASSKTYRYHLERAKVSLPFRSRFTLHHPFELDREALERGAALFVGTHDFAAFRASSCNAKTTMRNIFDSSWRDEGTELIYEVRATGFLQHQIRNMVGTMLELGRAKRTPQSIENLLARGERTEAGPTAAAKGLHLVEVHYGDR